MLVVGLVIGLLLLTGIWVAFHWDRPHSPTSPPQDVLRDVLLLTQTQISSFDPMDAFHEGHIQVVKQVYETLTDVDERGECIPLLADRWETSDNRLWRFHLRTDVLFAPALCFTSDRDRQLTAADVVYTFRRLLGPKSKSLGLAYFGHLAGFEEFHSGKTSVLNGVRAVGDDVVEFELAQPDAGFYRAVSLPYTSVVKEKAISSLGEDFPLKPVGTGPFQLIDFKPDQAIMLRRNPDYRSATGVPAPAVKEVRITLTRDTNAAFATFASGNSDFLVLDLPGLTRLRAEKGIPKVQIESKPTARFQFCLFNLQTVSKAETRRAISAAIDRRALQTVIGELGTIAESVFPPAIFPELAMPRTELTAVASKEAGTAAEPLPKELRLVCFNDTLSRTIAERLAADLRAHGCNLRIEAATFPVLVERLTRGEYDLVQIYWGPIYAEPAHYLGPFLSSQLPPQGNNFNRYANPAFDASVAEAKATSDPVERQRLFQQAEDTLLKDMPLLPLYFENLVRASNGRFDFPLHPLFYRRYQMAEPK